jgi:hypothetical protein
MAGKGTVAARAYKWDINTLAWVPDTGGGGEGGGGDASAANQVIGNASLDSIDDKIPSLESGRIPVILPSGGSGLTDTELRATAVPISGTIVVSDITDDATRDNGKIDVASLDQYTPVSGRLPVDGSGVTQPVSLSSVPSHPVTNAGTFAVQVTSAPTTTTKEVRSATPTQSSVGDSATNVTVLASNANRLGATIFNDSTAILRLKLGATASATSFTIAMAAQSYYEVPFGYTGIIDGIWASDAGGNARVTELT